MGGEIPARGMEQHKGWALPLHVVPLLGAPRSPSEVVIKLKGCLLALTMALPVCVLQALPQHGGFHPLRPPEPQWDQGS